MFSSNNMMVKAEVVDGHDHDPKGWNRVQVYIPAYHGEKDPDKIGVDNTGNSSKYPWAQSNISVFRQKTNPGFWQAIAGAITSLSGTAGANKNTEPLYPDTGDIVWVTFEGGDTRKPICMGIVASKIASNASSNGDLTCQDLPNLVVDILGMNEGSYQSINWNDNGATSIGKAQWNANRCRNILMKIREKDASGFDSIVASHGASNFLNDLNASVSWNTYLIGNGTARGNAVKQILGTEASKKAQDEQILADVQVYIDHAKQHNITDAAAIIYYCDVENQWGQGGASELGRSGCNDLESIHSYAMSHKYGHYATRRRNTYEAIKRMKDSGKLVATGLIHLEGANQGGQLLWPVPDLHTVTSGYGYRGAIAGTSNTGTNFHGGVDLSGGGALGKPIIAAKEGTVAYAAEGWNWGYGNVVFIDHGNNMQTRYAHQSKLAVTKGQKVQAGQVIGYVGSTGDSSGPHLHFEVRFNNNTTNPLPYIKG